MGKENILIVDTGGPLIVGSMGSRSGRVITLKDPKMLMFNTAAKAWFFKDIVGNPDEITFYEPMSDYFVTDEDIIIAYRQTMSSLILPSSGIAKVN